MPLARVNRIQLRHLNCFLAVARLGHLGRAAQALNVSQPAVTKTLAELEDILGVRLFERGRKGATLTPEAEVFLRHAGAVVSALDQAVHSVAPEQGQIHLTLGALPTVAPSFVARVLQAARREGLLAPVRVVTGSNRGLLAQLQQRELDAVIGRLSEPDRMMGLTFEHLYAEPLVVAVRPGHALLRAGAAVTEIGEHPLVLPLADTVIRHAADSWLQAHGVAPQLGVTETLSVSLARTLTVEGAAVWFTPLGAVEPDLASGLLRRLPVSTAGTEEPVGLLMPADAQPTGTLRRLLALVRGEAVARQAALAAEGRDRTGHIRA